jgi:hypothetical protein
MDRAKSPLEYTWGPDEHQFENNEQFQLMQETGSGTLPDKSSGLKSCAVAVSKLSKHDSAR